MRSKFRGQRYPPIVLEKQLGSFSEIISYIVLSYISGTFFETYFLEICKNDSSFPLSLKVRENPENSRDKSTRIHEHAFLRRFGKFGSLKPEARRRQWKLPSGAISNVGSFRFHEVQSGQTLVDFTSVALDTRNEQGKGGLD